MKNKLYQMAERMAKDLLSSEQAQEWLASLGNDPELWQEIISELPQKIKSQPKIIAPLAHLLSLWAKTSLSEKELNESNFWKGLGKLLQEDFKSANQLFAQVRSFNIKCDYKEQLCHHYLLFGDGFWAIRRKSQALEYYENAKKLAQEFALALYLSQAHIKIAHVYRKSEQISKAVAHYQTAFEAIKEEDVASATQILKELIKLYSENELEQAQDFFEQSLAYFQENNNQREVGVVLGEIGVMLAKKGEKEQAKDTLLEAVEIARKTGNYKSGAHLLTHLGNLYKALDCFTEAIRCFEESREMLRQIDPSGQGDDQGDSLISQADLDPEESLSEYDVLENSSFHDSLKENESGELSSVESISEAPLDIDSSFFSDAQVSALSNPPSPSAEQSLEALAEEESSIEPIMADSSSDIGSSSIEPIMADSSSLEPILEESSPFTQEELTAEETTSEDMLFAPSKEELLDLNPPTSQSPSAVTYTQHLAKQDRQNLQEQKAKLQQAKEDKKAVKQYRLLHSLGVTSSHIGEWDEAIRYWEESLVLAKKMRDWHYVLDNFLEMAKCYLSNEEFEQARKVLLQAVKILSENHRFLPFKGKSLETRYDQIFHLLIHCLLGLKKTASALHFLEQSQVWSYLCATTPEEILELCHASPVLKEEYLEASRELTRFYQELRQNLSQHTKESFAPLKKELKAKSSRLDELQTQLEVLDPKWASYFGREYRFDLAALQKSLADTTVVLEMVATQWGSVIFLIDQQQIDIITYDDLTSDYLGKLFQPCKEIEGNFYQGAPFLEVHSSWATSLQSITSKISDTLFPELLTRLEDRCADNLVVVLQGLWQYLPFHALPIMETQEQMYVQDYYEITYCSSAQLYAELKQDQEKEKLGLLSIRGEQKDYLFACLEAQALAQLWIEHPCICKKQQDYQEITVEEISQSDFLHCSTVKISQLFSGLPSFPQTESAFLEAERLAHFKMLTLARRGEMNLLTREKSIEKKHFFPAWYFSYHGCQAVVSSLWPTPDLATFILIHKLYQGLQEGQSIAASLQSAQIFLRKSPLSRIVDFLDEVSQLLPESVENKFWQDWPSWIQQNDLPDEQEGSLIGWLYYCSELAANNPHTELTIAREEKLGDWRPFASSLYWAGFVCSGNGLPEVLDAEEKLGEESIIYIEGLQSEGEEATHDFKDVEEALTSLTGEAIASEEKTEDGSSSQPRPKKNKERSSKLKVTAKCPGCGEKIKFALPSHGRKARCPSCKTKIRIVGKSTPYDHQKIPGTCPECGEDINCYLPMAGKKAKCPHCTTKLRLPKREILLAEIAAKDPNSRVLLLKV